MPHVEVPSAEFKVCGNNRRRMKTLPFLSFTNKENRNVSHSLEYLTLSNLCLLLY